MFCVSDVKGISIITNIIKADTKGSTNVINADMKGCNGSPIG